MRPAFRLGLVTATLTLVADQVTKLWVLFGYGLPDRGRIEVLPFLDLVMVWNRGVSYGLFQQSTDIGRWVLVGLSLVAAVVLLIWMRRETSVLAAFAMGLIMGGAIGNAIDRGVYGAVADFVLLHGFGFEWYVFNIADAAIVVGVVLLLYGAVRWGDRSDKAKKPTTVE